MEVLVVGSIGLDTIKTPYGTMKEGLGGSATYGSVAASFFAPVKVVGVVGDDFPAAHLKTLTKRKIDTSGIQIIKNGKTFRWEGHYDDKDMNSAITVKTDLNVFADFKPELPEDFKKTPFVFLGNIHPALQLCVLKQMKKPKLVILDSMNLWINTTRDELFKVLKMTDIILLNEGETKMLCDTNNLIEGARKLLKMGPKYAVIKKGEHGAMLISKNGIFLLPALPIDKVADPTGAGDSFAGGFIGYIASRGRISESILREAVALGSVIASFNVQDFSLNGMTKTSKKQVIARLKELRKLSQFDLPKF